MNTFKTCFAILALTTAAGSASAGKVMVHYTPFQTGNGGEFRIAHSSGKVDGFGKTGMMSDVTGTVTANNVADNGKILQNTSGDFFNNFSKGANATQRGQSTTNRGAADFQTFCIERSENVSNNTVYSYSIDAGAIRGGNGGGNPDIIGAHTAFLYNKFRSGALAGYNLWGSTVTEAMRESSAKTLQHVIWYFENELGGANTNQTSWTTALANIFVSNPNGLDAAQQLQARAWATDAVNAVAAGYTNTNVRALNLYTDNNNNGVFDQGDVLAQSQLTIIPLPGAVGLAMAGMVGMTIRRRRSM